MAERKDIPVFKNEPIMVLILGFITCGLYFIYWNMNVAKVLNAASGKEVISPVIAVLAGCCPPLNVYFYYLAGQAWRRRAADREGAGAQGQGHDPDRPGLSARAGGGDDRAGTSQRDLRTRGLTAHAHPPRSIAPDEARRCLLMAALGALALAASIVYAPWAHTGPILCPMRLPRGRSVPRMRADAVVLAPCRREISQGLSPATSWGRAVLVPIVGVPVLAFQGFTRRSIPLVHRLLFSRGVGYAFGGALVVYHATRLAEMMWTGTLWAGIRASFAVSVLHWLFG